MLQHLLSTRHWFLSDAFLDQVLPLALTRIEQGKDLSIFKVEEPVRSLSGDVTIAARDNFSFRTLINEKGQRVALIPLYGTMTRYGGLCSLGTAQLADMIKEANRNQNKISSILIDFDTPGGASNSIEVLDRAISASDLPVVGCIEMACSAGQWTASSIKKNGGKLLVDSNSNSLMGSIGAYTIHQNIMARLQANGVKVEIIRAPQSTDKARYNSVEEITQDLRDQLRDELKGLVDEFIGEIKTNYGNLKEDTPKLFTGGTFNGKKSIEIGLADGQGDLSETFHLAIDMANTRKKKTINFNSNMSLFKRLGLSLSLAQKLTAEELENVGNAEERLANAETENTRLSAENGTLTTRVEELEGQLATANGTISTHEATIAERDARIEELEEEPAATTTVVVADGDPEAAAKNQAIIDNLPHNKAADANPMFNGSSKPEEK
ncbi:MAG: S49 family peptidase [Cytophagia bacterium]|nr:S49 family peptidase [Cytophagia bacterium]